MVLTNRCSTQIAFDCDDSIIGLDRTRLITHHGKSTVQCDAAFVRKNTVTDSQNCTALGFNQDIAIGRYAGKCFKIIQGVVFSLGLNPNEIGTDNRNAAIGSNTDVIICYRLDTTLNFNRAAFCLYTVKALYIQKTTGKFHIAPA